jgi:hypothetical protein
VFAEVVAVTGNGLPKRSGSSTSIHLRHRDRSVALYRAAGQCCSQGIGALDGGGTCDRE